MDPSSHLISPDKFLILLMTGGVASEDWDLGWGAATKLEGALE
jgi:hypothetical protein